MLVNIGTMWSSSRATGEGGSVAVSGASDLLAGETQGLAFDFTDDHWLTTTSFYASARIIDTVTPANDRNTSPDTAASSLLTYTSPSAKMVMGPAGTLRWAAHNLVTYSEQFDNAAWTKSTLTVTANSVTAPDGTSATADALTGTSGDCNVRSALMACALGADYTFSLWAKVPSGTKTVRFYANDQTGTAFNNSNTAGLTTTWQQFSFTINSAAATSIQLQFGGFSTIGNGEVVHVSRAQVYRYPADTTYLATTTAARYSLPIEFSSGVPVGLLVEPARTNLCLYSDDLTNAAWTKSNLTTAKTATGPNGVANSATTCTASAGNATALQAITSASAARVTGVWLKRRTGTGNIDVTQDNGTTWATQVITSSWARYSIASVTSTNPTVGIRVVTSGDAVDVCLFQHEVGANVSSAIPTTTATVTRAVDNISALTSIFAHSATVNTAVIKYIPFNVAAAMAALRWDDTTANERVDVGHSASAVPGLTVTDGGAAQTAPLTSGTITLNTAKKLGVKWKANDFVLSNAGATGATDTSGTLPTVTTLKLGPDFHGYIVEVLVLPADKSTVQVEALAAA